MKAFILLLFLVVASYVGWVNIPPDVRTTTLKKIKPHVFRLAILITVVVALAYAMYFLPSFRLT